MQALATVMLEMAGRYSNPSPHLMIVLGARRSEFGQTSQDDLAEHQPSDDVHEDDR